MAPPLRTRKSRSLLLPLLLCASTFYGSLFAFITRSCSWRRPPHHAAVVRLAGFPGMNGVSKALLDGVLKDPAKMKQLQEEAEKIMGDPQKRKMVEDWQNQMQASLKQLEDDPEMKDFFEDIRKNGLGAMRKYEKNEKILQKFAALSGAGELSGTQDMAGVGGISGTQDMPDKSALVPEAMSLKPGDEVIIHDLTKAPELNGRTAMIIPPTPDERKTLAGTNRLIVRLLDSGEQFAVKPENVRSTIPETETLSEQEPRPSEEPSLSSVLQTEASKLQNSGKLDDIANDPELKPVFEDIRKNGMQALEKYWNDDRLMQKINQVMGSR